MNKAVGLFFFVGLAGLGALTFWVDDEANIFKQPGTEYRARFPTAAGLQKNDWVYLAGLHAGRVLEVALDEAQGDIVVRFLLNRGYTLRRDSEARLVSTSVLTSAQQLHLTVGSPGAEALPPGSFVARVHSSPNLGEILASVGEVVDAIGGNGEEQGTLAKLIHDPKLYEELHEGVASFKAVIQKVESGEGTAGKFFNDPKLYDELLAAAKRIEEGMTGLRDLTSDIREGEGTLAKFIQDPEVYEELRGLLKSMHDAVEDAREQAPVSTFTSVIFSSIL